MAWLPKATYPVRAGTHGNSAFALVLAWRYAAVRGDPGFGEALGHGARAGSRPTPTCRPWEPSGADFLSPTLIEAECMRLMLPADDFAAWFAASCRAWPRASRRPVHARPVSDRTDGQIAHLDGLNLSRAWCWRHLAAAAPDALRPRLRRRRRART